MIERVRYPNPLPELPYPPKLVQIPAPEANYVSPMYLQRLSDTLQLPVTVDAEAGMPMDLARLEYLWLGDSTHPIEKEEESTSIVDEKLDEDDAFLLTDLAGSQSNEMEDMAQDDIPVPVSYTHL